MAGERPHDAATVILLRDRPEGAYELFLMRRGANQAFMGGAHVFPGGRLEDADTDPELLAFTGGFGPSEAKRLLQQGDLPEAVALGLFMAAIRETFEESGILLARDRRSAVVDLSDPGTAARFFAHRLELHANRMTLADLAGREGLSYAPELLTPYARWITPADEYGSRRFDARFFLAKLPQGQLAAHDRMELTDSRWITPAAALEEHAAGRIVLMPPTLKTVEELLPFSAAGPLLAAAALGRIEAILPEAFRTADGLGFRFPQDSEYTLTGRREPRHPRETTRVVLEGGIWRSRSK